MKYVCGLLIEWMCEWIGELNGGQGNALSYSLFCLNDSLFAMSHCLVCLLTSFHLWSVNHTQSLARTSWIVVVVIIVTVDANRENGNLLCILHNFELTVDCLLFYFVFIVDILLLLQFCLEKKYWNLFEWLLEENRYTVNIGVEWLKSDRHLDGCVWCLLSQFWLAKILSMQHCWACGPPWPPHTLTPAHDKLKRGDTYLSSKHDLYVIAVM